MIPEAQELVRMARSMMAGDEPNGLNGMSKNEARKFVNALLSRHTKGFFDDQYWRPINNSFKEMDIHNVPYDLKKAEYRHDRNGNPSSKVWVFEIEFVNNRGRDTTLYGTMTASGGGPVDDPLERYDVTAYVN